MRNIFIPCSIEQCALDFVNSASPDCRKPEPEDASFGVGDTATDHVGNLSTYTLCGTRRAVGNVYWSRVPSDVRIQRSKEMPPGTWT